VNLAKDGVLALIVYLSFVCEGHSFTAASSNSDFIASVTDGLKLLGDNIGTGAWQNQEHGLTDALAQNTRLVFQTDVLKRIGPDLVKLEQHFDSLLNME
jgi:hypothetical protein